METTIRFLIFGLVFLAIALIEYWHPYRARRLPRRLRWPSNIGLAICGIFVLRLLAPMSLISFALAISEHGWGLMALMSAPKWVAVPLSIIFMDLAVYAQHIVMHRVSVLWRLHRVHHADIDLDVSSALRFHPLEIGLSMAWKFLIVMIVGVPSEAVLVFEIILNASAMFNHGNFTLPTAAEKWVRLLFITPDMHRIHHSVVPIESNSNYGFFLSIWDRLFRTARIPSGHNHHGLIIGLNAFRDKAESRIDRLLTQPFRSE